MELKEFKKEYHKLEVKYKLPRFEELNESFEIEKLENDTEILLRVVRKNMTEKIMSYLSFVEMLLNPVNLPQMYVPFLKGLNAGGKERLNKLYGAYAELVVDSLENEIDYNEKREAELICKINKIWKDSVGDFKKILEEVRNPADTSMRKEKSYFG